MLFWRQVVVTRLSTFAFLFKFSYVAYYIVATLRATEERPLVYFFFFSFVIKGRVTGSNLLFTFKKFFFYLNQNLKRPLGKSKIIWRLDVFIRRPCALGHSLKTNTIISKQKSLIYRTIVLIGRLFIMKRSLLIP